MVRHALIAALAALASPVASSAGETTAPPAVDITDREEPAIEIELEEIESAVEGAVGIGAPPSTPDSAVGSEANAEATDPSPGARHRIMVELEAGTEIEDVSRAWAVLGPSVDGSGNLGGFLLVRFDGAYPLGDLLALVRATKGVRSAAPDAIETLKPAPQPID